MIDREHELSLTRQAELLDLSRASLYYEPVPTSEADLALMRRIDELHTELPFLGSRQLQDQLNQQGFPVGRKHVATLMRRMGIEAIYRRRNTSKRHPGHAVYPYLLRGLLIDRPNQVWAADITYIPMARGFVYLFAVMDWATRKVLAWRLSNSLSADFCVEAVEEAIANFGKPEIFNTDQGSQFTGSAFVGMLKKHEIRISMDGRGRALDICGSLGNPEIEHLDRACGGEFDVGWFQIAVDDATIVCGSHRIGDLTADADHFWN